MTGSGRFVGLGKHPVRIRRLDRPAEGPDVMSRHRVSQRAGDDIAIAVARHRSNIRVETDANMRDPILNPGIFDLRLLDRNEPIIELLARFFTFVDRMGEGLGDVVIDHLVERVLIAAPISFEDHTVSGFRAFDETADIELGIGRGDGAQA